MSITILLLPVFTATHLPERSNNDAADLLLPVASDSIISFVLLIRVLIAHSDFVLDWYLFITAG
jgi:hypothetical protein